MLRIGVAPLGVRLLTTIGRRSGKEYSNPVQLVKMDGKRYLVAPYGEVSWVRNARASGRVAISNGRRTESLGIREVDAEEAGFVLKRYVKQAPVVLPYFEAKLSSPVETFIAEASEHPVFELLHHSVGPD